MKNPVMKFGQFAVLACDGYTGIVLRSVFKHHAEINDLAYLIFDNNEAARSFVGGWWELQGNLEFSVFNDKLEFVEGFEMADLKCLKRNVK